MTALAAAAEGKDDGHLQCLLLLLQLGAEITTKCDSKSVIQLASPLAVPYLQEYARQDEGCLVQWSLTRAGAKYSVPYMPYEYARCCLGCNDVFAGATTHYLLPTTYCLLLTTYYLLLTTYYLPLTTHYSLLTTAMTYPQEPTRSITAAPAEG